MKQIDLTDMDIGRWVLGPKQVTWTRKEGIVVKQMHLGYKDGWWQVIVVQQINLAYKANRLWVVFEICLFSLQSQNRNACPTIRYGCELLWFK